MRSETLSWSASADRSENEVRLLAVVSESAETGLLEDTATGAVVEQRAGADRVDRRLTDQPPSNRLDKLGAVPEAPVWSSEAVADLDVADIVDRTVHAAVTDDGLANADEPTRGIVA